MPDTKFEYPINAFKGVRIVLQSPTEEARRKTRNRLMDVHAFTEKILHESLNIRFQHGHKEKDNVYSNV